MSLRNPALPALTCPAGDPEKLRAAVRFGADEVYLSGKIFGMRSACGNFTAQELADAVAYAHAHGVRVNVTVNTMPRFDEYDALERYLGSLAEIRPDALIVADLGVLALAKELAPGIELHVSTQAGAVSHADCIEWYKLGARRVVLARELTLEEIIQIRKRIPDDLGLETFIHGSMCVAWSGRCLLSANLTGRDGNRGACAQPCRWNYELFRSDSDPCAPSAQDPESYYELDEEKRRGRRLPIVENDLGTFVMSSKDMCMIDHVPELCEAGIDALKIEGRVKSACYAAVTAYCYRHALDGFAAEGSGYRTPEEISSMLDCVSHRVYGTGFYFSRPDDSPDAQLCPAGQTGYLRENPYLAAVVSYDAESGRASLRQRCKFSEGDSVALLTPEKGFVPFAARDLRDAEGEPIGSTPHPGMEFTLPVPFPVEAGDMLIQM